MLTVTESAKQILKETLTTNSDDPKTALRLSIKPPDEFGLVLGTEADGDQVVEHEGMKVLLLESELAEIVEGFTLDVQDTNGGSKLVMRKE